MDPWSRHRHPRELASMREMDHEHRGAGQAGAGKAGAGGGVMDKARSAINQVLMNASGNGWIVDDVTSRIIAALAAAGFARPSGLRANPLDL